MNYYKRHLGDYAKNAGHLSMIEHGAYTLILDNYYAREQGPTLLEATRWARARSEEEKAAVLAVLDEFFVLGADERYTQKRVEEELGTYRVQAEVNRGIAMERERRKRERREHDTSTNRAPDVDDSNQDREPSHKPLAISHKEEQTPSSEQSPDGEQVPVKAAPAEKKRKKHGSEEDHKAARWLYNQVLKVNATAREPSWDGWANEVRLMREIDGRTHHDICELMRWALEDSFWCGIILSPNNLREKWDMLTVRRATGGNGGGGRPSSAGIMVVGDAPDAVYAQLRTELP